MNPLLRSPRRRRSGISRKCLLFRSLQLELLEERAVLSGVYGWTWNDADLNALWDEGESALQGRTVFLDTDQDGLLDAAETRTTTDADGYYWLDVLTPGNYAVAQVLPSGWGQTWPTGVSQTVTVGAGDSWVEADFGSAEEAVYGWVWDDVDLDTVWDVDESALTGWTVFLDADKDAQLDAGESSTTTDTYGYYAFGGLPAGEYTVDQVIPAGWQQTWPAETAHTVTVNSANLWAEADFGNAQGAIYGWAWDDVDLSATWEAGESALDGWTVFLDTNKDGQLDAGEASTTTDSNGYYVLGGLSTGEYTVAQIIPAGWGQTWPAETAHTVTISSSELWIEADFGNAEGAVYGWTWDDANLNSVWDVDELALEGRTVFLDTDKDGQLDADETSTITDANGYYLLGGLSIGEYTVTQVVPSGWGQTSPLDPAHSITIDAENLWWEADFGSAQGAVYGWLWDDANLDTVWDVGESPLENWTVFLDADKDDQLDADETSTTTDANGYFLLNNLPTGEYTVAQVVPSDWKQTWPADTAHTLTLTDTDLWLNADFGNAQGAIYGWTWHDENLDTLWDVGESALEGWTVFLDTDNDGQLDADETSTTTDENGYYLFNSLSPGDYTLAQVIQPGWGQTWPSTAAHAVTISEESLWAETYFGKHEVLVVSDVTFTNSGFVVQFNRDFETSVLNLYDQEDAMGAADVVLKGATEGEVGGSLFIDASLRQVTFIKTGGALQPDSYTVTLRGTADGFCETGGIPLDGDVDGFAGGEYVGTFSVLADSTRVISVPDFARGPKQSIDVPATGAGIPITLSDGDVVDRVEFTFQHDPATLEVTGVALSEDLQTLGWSVQVDLQTAGQVGVIFSGGGVLPTGEILLGNIEANVPAGAAYAAATLLSFDNVQLNEGGIAVRLDEAVQVVAYFGDTTGNGDYSGLDASYIARVAVGLDTGHAAFPRYDPRITSDITGNGRLSALDAAYVAHKAVGLPQSDIPDLPADLLSTKSVGSDSVVPAAAAMTLYLGTDVTVSAASDESAGNQTIEASTVIVFAAESGHTSETLVEDNRVMEDESSPDVQNLVADAEFAWDDDLHSDLETQSDALSDDAVDAVFAEICGKG